MENTQITKYVIRQDKEPIFYADNEKDAIETINRLAKEQTKKIESKTYNLYTKELNEGKEIQIHSQSKGYVINGSIQKICTYDIIPVCQVGF